MEKLYSHAAFFLPLLLSSLQLLSSDYSPEVAYFINCGSNSNFKLGNRNFLGDKNYGNISFAGKSSTDSDRSATRNNSPLYQTARVFNRPSFYRFSIDRRGTYVVRLHFYAFSSKTNLASAKFNVTALFGKTVPGFALLSKFSAQNSSNSPVIKEFFVTINPKKFRIAFVPYGGASLAFVNALEVFLAPQNFIPSETPRVTRNGESDIPYRGLLSQALQTVHRINVGGDPVDSDVDALWRNWTTDDIYLLNPVSTTVKAPYDGKLNYSSTNATAEMAPDPVYKTTRNLTSTSNFNNMTWRFNVSRNSGHLVRMHFCDILDISENMVSFDLYIYDNLIERIDPYGLYFEVGVPFCLDFVVDSDESGFMGIGVVRVYGPPFLNGVEILELVEKTPPAPWDDEPKKTHRLALAVGLAAGSVAIFISLSLVVVVVVVLKRRKAAAFDVLNLKVGLKIPFSVIKRATKNFDKKRIIGQGGFGKVYIGTLNGVKVAVKRGEAGHEQGLAEFQTEITILSKISHRRLVSLIGYCDEKSEMILVYEYMEQGTLRDHLYQSKKSSPGRSPTLCPLSWKQRLEICIHSAEGLTYLHTSSDGGIIHRDVKSTNILLDEHFNAKVADFGISRFGQFDQPHVSTDIKGSFGYLDPEYFGSQQLTKKSDVYSFGVVLLEVLCARPAVDTKLPGEQANLAEWAMSWQKRGQLEEIIDPRLVGDINPTSLRKFWETAEKCLRECGARRPNMEDVLWELQYVYALEFQQSATQTEPCEDSTTNAWLQWPSNVMEHLPSHSFSSDQKDDVPLSMDDRSQTTASEVFSQLKIDAPR